jgi:site-specific recombinase XerC
MKDITFATDVAWILVHGKGRKQREVALGKKARLALSCYLHRERHSDDENVFIGKKGALSAEGLDRLLYRLRDVAGAQNFVGVRVAAHRSRLCFPQRLHTFMWTTLSSGRFAVYDFSAR